MSKIKAWMTEHKALAAGLLGGLITLVYWLYARKKAVSQTSDSTQAAGMVYTSPATSSGGVGSSSGGVDTSALTTALQNEQDQQKSFMSGLTDTLTSFMTGIQGTISSQAQSTKDLLTGQAQSNKDLITQLNQQAQSNENNLISEITGMLKTAGASQPNVPAYTTQPTVLGGTATQPQTGNVSGGTVYTTTPTVIQQSNTPGITGRAGSVTITNSGGSPTPVKSPAPGSGPTLKGVPIAGATYTVPTTDPALWFR